MHRAAFLWLVASLAILAGTGAHADEPPRPFPPPAPPVQAQDIDVQALLQRLEQAESRIRTLERLQSPTTPDADPPPPAFTASSESAARVSVNPAAEPSAPDFVFLDESPNDGLAESLKALQARQDELDEQNKNLADTLSKGFVIPGTSNATVRLSGRIHADYWAYSNDDTAIREFEGMDPQDRFSFRRVRMGVDGKIRDNMIYKIEMEFAEASEPAHKDTYIGFTDLPLLQQVQLGIQKRPYGLDHLNSSRYNIFMERPFIIEAFNQDTRRLGLVSYGVSENEAWNWRYGVYNLEDPQTTAGYFSDHYQLEFAGRLANAYWYDETSDGRGYAHWAISGTVASPDGDGGPLNSNEARFRTRPEARTEERWLNTGRIAHARRYELLGVEKVINVGPWQFVAEYQNVWLQRAGAREDLFFLGGYAYLAYMLTGEHVPWERDSGTIGRVKPFENFFLVETGDGRHGGGWGAWQVALRYSHADLTNADILGGVGDSITFGLNWYWNPNARLQFNYLHGWITDHEPVNGQTEGEYDIIGARAMVDF